MNQTEQAKLFGLTSEQAEKVKDIRPTLNVGKMPVGTVVEVTVESGEPYAIQWEDEATGEQKESLALTVIKDGFPHTLWLGAQSLRQEFYRIYREAGNLHGAKVLISVDEYQHPKFGGTRGYRVVLKEQ